MARSRSRSPAASPGTSGSKRRRYDDRDDTPDASTSSRATGHHRERDSGRERERDGDRDGDRSRGGREPRERSRERRREKESGRSERDHERDRDGGSYRSGERANERASDGRDRDGHRSRGHESPRDDRRSGGSSRRDDRDGSRQRDREYREGRDSRDSYRSPRPRSRSPPSRNRSYSPAVAPTPPPVLKPAFASTFSSASPAPARPESPALPASPNPAKGDDEKIRLRKEKLEAWKAQKAADAAAAASSKPLVKASTPIRPAPAALSSSPLVLRPESNTDETLLTELPAKPLAFTATSTLPKSSSLPAKPAFSFTSNTSRPSNLKTMAMGNVEDDEGETRMGLVEFGAEAVDMNMEVGAEDEGEEDEEDLDGGAAYARKEPREVVGMDVDTEEVVEEVPMQAVEEEEEVDELDAFMSNVQAEVKNVDKQDKARLGGGKAVDRMSKLVEPENEDGDDDEEPSEDEVDRVGDSASDILALAAKKVVKRGRELHSVDHSKIKYEDFRKAFYHAPPEVEALTPEEVEEMRIEMDGIKVRGADPPKPVAKWSYCGLPAPCIEVIKGLGYEGPTSIQAQAIPAIMSGRDIIGVAKTGSGKTVAFLLPMFRHIKDQRPLRTMEGPIAMVVTPTRELATQIHKECKPFLKALGLRASCAYGGTPLKENIAEMKRGSEVIVCTPGRMIELLTTNSGRIINLQRITYLVLDEADRMFDMGFEPQVMKILNQIRPDRQTVLFSATFPRQMEALARKILRRPLEITVGGRSIVAPEIDQIVEVRAEDNKFNRLLELLGHLSNEDADARALIFVERQDGADKLLTDLLRKNYSCMSLHGGMEQVDRDQTIADFKSGVVPIVIATSVAARGLDVKQLKLVVQYDAPNHMEDYVHRAGRTGRAGNKGTCVTFVTPEQDRYALDIFKALIASSATVPADLRALAESFAEKVKEGKASGAVSGFGGKGLERLDNDRDAHSRAERAAYGETPGEKKAEEIAATIGGAEVAVVDVADLEVEIKKGRAPEPNRKATAASVMDAVTIANMRAAEAKAIAQGTPAGIAKAQSVIANFNAMLKAKTQARSGENDLSTDSARRRDPIATDYHAIIYINDYPQKARWKVTNKETMVQLVESTGASITNKGTYYEPGKEPGPDDLPKLHFLIESNEEFRVKHAISEIKRSLIEGATMALEAEQRNNPNGTGPPGRYVV